MPFCRPASESHVLRRTNTDCWNDLVWIFPLSYCKLNIFWGPLPSLRPASRGLQAAYGTLLMNSDNHAGCRPALRFMLLRAGPTESFSCCSSIQILCAPALPAHCCGVITHAKNNNGVSPICNFVEDVWSCCIKVDTLSIERAEDGAHPHNQAYCPLCVCDLSNLCIKSILYQTSKAEET